MKENKVLHLSLNINIYIYIYVHLFNYIQGKRDKRNKSEIFFLIVTTNLLERKMLVVWSQRYTFVVILLVSQTKFRLIFRRQRN